MEGKDLICEMEIREGDRDQDKDGDKKKETWRLLVEGVLLKLPD